MPPRHAKTTIARRALAHVIKKYPDRLNGLGMHGEKSAQHQSRQIRKLVLAEGVELAADAKSVGLWLTPQEGGLFATGVFGQWTGKGINGVLVLDDILKGRAPAESPAHRDKLWQTLTDDILTRPDPPNGSVIMIATRWHTDDPPGRLIRHAGEEDFPQFEVINLPALRDPITNEPSDAPDAIALWPERFPAERMRERRAVLGPYGWSSLFQGRPRTKGGKVFGKNDVEPFRYDLKPDGTPDLSDARIVLSVDPAGTAKTTANHSVAVALAFRGHGAAMTCDLVDVLRKQLEPQDFAPLLYAFQIKWGGAKLVIEATRDGKALAKALLKIESRLRFKFVTPIGDKFTRAQPVAAAYNAGKFRLPRVAEWLFDVLYEFSEFTGLGDESDDIVDACGQGWNAADSGGGGASGSDSDFMEG
jgi:predicted phage terminase large subunit-like protein